MRVIVALRLKRPAGRLRCGTVLGGLMGNCEDYDEIGGSILDLYSNGVLAIVLIASCACVNVDALVVIYCVYCSA